MIPRSTRLLLPVLVVSLVILITGGCRTWSSSEERAAQAYNEGNTFREAGMQEEAVRAYLLALEHEPEMSAATYNMALTLVDLDRSDEALVQLQILNQRDPMNLKVLRAMGWAAWEGGRPDASLDYYQAVLIIFPADEEALRGASEVYEALNRPADAVKMRIFLARLNDTVEIRMDLAQTYYMAGWYTESLDVYQEVLIQDPENPEALAGASVTTEEMGMYRDSIKYRLELVDTAADTGETWWHIARLRLVEIGDYEGGLKALETALEEGFSDDDALEDLLISSPSAIRSVVRNLLSENAGNQQLVP